MSNYPIIKTNGDIVLEDGRGCEIVASVSPSPGAGVWIEVWSGDQYVQAKFDFDDIASWLAVVGKAIESAKVRGNTSEKD